MDALGRLTTSVYDAVSRVTARMDALGHSWMSRYDENGNRIAAVNPLGFATSYSFDALDRRTATMDPLGRVHATSYDAAGRLHARRATHNELMAVASSLVAEFSGQLPAGTVLRGLAQTRERLLAAGVRAGLAPAAETAARAQLNRLVPAHGAGE